MHGRRRGGHKSGGGPFAGREAPAGPPEQDGDMEILEVVGVDEPAGAAVGQDAGPAAAEPPAPAAGDLLEALGERDRLRELLLRTRADFDNFQKRAARDSERLRATVTADLLLRLLPVLDNLERAVGSAAPSGDPVQRGVALIHQQLLDALVKEGLEPLDTLGAPFDPRWHEAVEVLAVEGLAPGTILEEMVKGYRFKDRLLRPALVRVVAGRGPMGEGTEKRTEG